MKRRSRWPRPSWSVSVAVASSLLCRGAAPPPCPHLSACTLARSGSGQRLAPLRRRLYPCHLHACRRGFQCRLAAGALPRGCTRTRPATDTVRLHNVRGAAATISAAIPVSWSVRGSCDGDGRGGMGGGNGCSSLVVGWMWLSLFLAAGGWQLRRGSLLIQRKQTVVGHDAGTGSTPSPSASTQDPNKEIIIQSRQRARKRCPSKCSDGTTAKLDEAWRCCYRPRPERASRHAPPRRRGHA